MHTGKQGDAKVNAFIIEEERAKSCDEKDFLLVLCTVDKTDKTLVLEDMIGVVQESQSSCTKTWLQADQSKKSISTVLQDGRFGKCNLATPWTHSQMPRRKRRHAFSFT